MYRGGSRRQQRYLIAGDVAIVLTTFYIAMEYWWWKAGPESGEFFPFALFNLAAYLTGLTIFDLFDIHTDYARNKAATMTRILSAVLATNLALSGLFYLYPPVKLPRGVFLIQMGLAIPLLFFWRVYFRRLRQEILVPRRVLIVGAGEAGLTSLDIVSRFGLAYEVVGFVDDDLGKRTRKIGHFSVLGGADELVSLVQAHQVEGIIVAIKDKKQKRLVEAMLQCRMHGVFVTDLLTLGEELAGRVLVQYAEASWFVFSPGFLILHHRMFRRIKRITDVVCAAAGLILAAPILLLSLVLIKLGSPGPVMFRQPRVGQDERRFWVLKLRTMTEQAETDSPYTATQDPRVTRVGRILRFLRIDEIPQMLNVLKGEMSFIGPRAEWDILVNEYKEKIPYYSFRHLMRPGITGWAQINYSYGSSVEDAFRKLEYDLYYIKNMSMGLDLRILLKTISVVLFGKGAR